jgi:hypothetical protein
MHFKRVQLNTIDAFQSGTFSPQIKLLQGDLAKAKEAINIAEKLSGGRGDVREAKHKLWEMMKEVRFVGKCTRC